MKIPLKMKYTTDIWHDEILSGPEGPYHGSVLCAVAKDIDVTVFDTGLPGACGSEFLFNYAYPRDVSKISDDIIGHTKEDKCFQEACLYMSLSAVNGWGHANCGCFKPLSAYDFGFIEEE